MNTRDLSYEDLKERLFISVINYEDNKDILESFPHIKRGEFAIYVQLCVGDKNVDGDYSAFITVTHDMLSEWFISKEDLFALSQSNSIKLFPPELINIKEFAKYNSSDLIPDGTAVPNIYVLSNRQHFNGAAALFCDNGVLNETLSKEEKEIMILLPTGANEIYCIPSDKQNDLNEYQNLFDDIAKGQEKNDLLANNVLIFDLKNQEIQDLTGTKLNNIVEHDKIKIHGRTR